MVSALFVSHPQRLIFSARRAWLAGLWGGLLPPASWSWCWCWRRGVLGLWRLTGLVYARR